jgi:DNA-binding IclR family transcriptional regulator
MIQSAETQLLRVLDAIDEMDLFSAANVQSATGLPRKHCAAYISQLKREGFVGDSGRFVQNYDDSRRAKLFTKCRIGVRK